MSRDGENGRGAWAGSSGEADWWRDVPGGAAPEHEQNLMRGGEKTMKTSLPYPHVSILMDFFIYFSFQEHSVTEMGAIFCHLGFGYLVTIFKGPIDKLKFFIFLHLDYIELPVISPRITSQNFTTSFGFLFSSLRLLFI